MTEFIHGRPSVTSMAAGGGIFTRPQALAAGVSDREIQRLVSSGEWHRIRRGVYIDAHTYETMSPNRRHLVEVRSALLRVDGPAVASHWSAGVVHDLDMAEADLSLVHLTRPELRSARIEAGVCHHRGALEARTVCAAGGVAVTSVARTVLDLARLSSFDAGVVVADCGLRRGVNRSELVTELLACRDWAGSRTASRVVAFADGRSESPGESLARVAFDELRLPTPELQAVFRTRDGSVVARTDFLFREYGTVAEFDGRRKYYRDLGNDADPGEVVWREKLREDALREHFGLEVVRLTWADLAPERRTQLAKRIRSAFSRASASTRAA
ncbi:type IV toxin-antitoxin system AbiEi family antitoxin domain-containing protein [Actinopolymorpha sp. B11F2]|uniref:type IV toxin-antitoxin system AbiEi family antitoxin domain-containing protein n=1 Tax=Actinopolymorpha sp. B11F2 TaxID=3160862 RepID=UPI0032E402E1